MTLSARDICTRAPVIPVLVVEDANAAVPLVRALVAGGLPVVEITLRTAAAIGAIRSISDALPDVLVGAGSVLGAAQMEAVGRAGGRFAVSPGATRSLLEAAREQDMPILPGVQSASEVMRLLEAGVDVMKFFPAAAAGGPGALAALAGPLPQAAFCPTGGITALNAPEYLALGNVLCVGGSWVAPRDAVAAGDWAQIERLAADAAALAGGAATS